VVKTCPRLLVCVGLLVLVATTAAAQDPSTGAGGVQLPPQLGIGMTLYSQNQDYRLESLSLGLPGIDPSVTKGLPVVNRTNSYHLKLDYWVLPYLNLYVIGGRLETTTTVSLKNIDIGLPFQLGDLVIDNNGWVYGGGATFAVGGPGWFGSATVTYTKADLSVTDGSVEAWVFTPKIGLTVRGGAVWVGAMYQDAQEKHKGTYEIPYIGKVPFDVVLGESSSWNGIIGATAGLSDHFVLIMEGGFGPRHSAMVSLEYRR
jgi:hypothetical protein